MKKSEKKRKKSLESPKRTRKYIINNVDPQRPTVMIEATSEKEARKILKKEIEERSK